MEKATLEQVREYIRHSDKNALEAINDIIRSRWKHLTAELSFNFTRGDMVSWIRGKRDQRREGGKVVAVDAKWVYVQMYAPPVDNQNKWDIKVSPTLCTKMPGPSW